ncbi:MAG: DUF4405 domain-containing protein [Proteobacteria bacterium]|nr:DUF4405 domain-containing protein [Pseudomonadota bacterium]
MNHRGLTSFFTLTGFLIMTVTGIVLYFVPQGRISYWMEWTFLGLTKTDWGNLHTVSSLLWAVAGGFHLYFNWGPLTAYIYRKARGGWRLKRELILASVVSVVVVVFSLYSIPPVSYIIDLGDYLKGAWVSNPDYEPPISHAEQFSLKTFCKKMNIDPDQAVAALRVRGFKVDDPARALQAIARDNRTAPMNLYLAIKHLETRPAPETRFTAEGVEERFSGTGLGRKTLAQVLTENGLDAKAALARLRSKGLEPGPEETMKEAADRHGASAIDLLKAALVDDYRIEDSTAHPEKR